MRYGAPWPKTVLVTAAWAGVRRETSEVEARFLGVKAGGGDGKAILAGVAPMLAACDDMLRGGVPYRDLGPERSALRDEAETRRCLVRRPRGPGCEVDARHAAQSLLIAKL